jgi:hypothetical protein
MTWKQDKNTKKSYSAWQSMKTRCSSNPKSRYYPLYFMRNIKVCDRWKENFYAFFVDMGECPDGYTLERIDNDKGYFPENCKWATRQEQSINTRKTIWLTHDGITLSAAEWAVKIGVPKQTVYSRIKRNLPIEEILSNVTLKTWSHGTQKAYEKHKCRCDECCDYIKQNNRRKYLKKLERNV